MHPVSADRCELTILMPCLNEAETLATCIRKANAYLEQAGVRGEVLIADNGSTDGSQAIAEALGARVVNVTERGYGAALQGGIAAAHGTYIIMGDADDSYDFARLEAFVAALRAGHQLVMGNRFKGGIAAGAMPFLHKYLGNPVLSFLGRLFFKVPIGDFHCGLRGFHTQSMRDLGLKTTGMEFASEMVVKSALGRLRIAEVPTTLAKDGRNRRPHLRTFRDGWRHLCFLLATAPLWLFIYPGLLMLGLGLGLAVPLLAGPVHLGGITLDSKSFVFCCLSMLLGFQSLTLGLIVHSYAVKRGFIPLLWPENSPLNALTRDRLALVAGIFFAVGLGLVGFCLWRWFAVGLGNLQNPLIDKLAVLALTAFACAIQCFHSAFIYELTMTDKG